ncbi:MAG: hypothetical protein ACI8WT_003830 [Clostridium sp.]|jgi:hypothetical protein
MLKKSVIKIIITFLFVFVFFIGRSSTNVQDRSKGGLKIGVLG